MELGQWRGRPGEPLGGALVRNGWAPGPAAAAAAPGPLLVSATRFVYRGWRFMPLVWLNGWALRRSWAGRPGAVGVYTAVDATRPITYSVSVWTSPDDLRRFLGAPEHVRLVRGFRARLEHSVSVSWEVDRLAPEELWRDGLRRLAARLG